MLTILGIALVLAAVFGGYIAEKGNPYVLLQPAELWIVGGAAAGIVLIANPPATIAKMLRGVRIILFPREAGRVAYLRALRMLYEILSYLQRAGQLALERHIEDPASSSIFSQYPELLRDNSTMNFLCDSLRLLVIGATTAGEIDRLMETDIEVQRRGHHQPVSALNAIADALPGLGIVAAVLGVVITMQSIGAAPQTVGEKVAAALVGTFLGILLCYGVVGPLAARLESLAEAHAQYLQVLRTAIVAFVRGASPLMSLEFARRSIPPESRPGFEEMEIVIRREARVPPATPPPGATEENAKAAASA
ncbi:MAG TPA: flagellar motor stator protein MotA [Bryobacteraceae bacterium]|nr:flagellar motor stator protein MotA [Bryobacteraceae bacterium]